MVMAAAVWIAGAAVGRWLSGSPWKTAAGLVKLAVLLLLAGLCGVGGYTIGRWLGAWHQ
jgi:hypothetical protein